MFDFEKLLRQLVEIKAHKKISSLKVCPRCHVEVEMIDGECWNCGYIFEDDESA